ncbi:MAG: SDR family oxidoreductase [Myxococcota bacterium]|nr:SDR family oxidoreductase [Myxococcota bacterium]
MAKHGSNGSHGSPEHARTESHPRPPFPAQKLGKPGLESELDPKPRYEAPTYKPAGKLDGKRALITGGDSGIGRAVAVMFAREGADVSINYLAAEQEDAEETKAAVEAVGKRCILLPGDLFDAELCKRLVDETVDQLGGIDILVSNAAHQNRKKLDELDPEEFDRTMKVNVYAYYYLTQAAVPHMKPGSAILATSSSTGYRGSEDLPDYSATKGAINQFTKALAKQLLDKGIRVNAVAPGPVWTPLNAADEGMKPKDVAVFGEKTPMERPAQPEEIAPAFVFLASEADSSFITGIVLPVLGGETIGA